MPHPAATTSPDWRAALNPDQRRAVEHAGSPLVVLAGPGTGKTRVIIARIRHQLEAGADPSSILALTFSVKAAEEMRQRLAEAVGHRVAERVRLSTFHAFGASVVRRFGAHVGYPPRPTLMDSAQRKRLLRRLIIDGGLFQHIVARGRDSAIDDAGRFISDCRNNARTPSDALAHAAALSTLADANPDHLAGDDLAALRERALTFGEHARLFEAWDAACTERGLATFDDYLSLPLRIFERRPAALAILRSELRHLLVDEFQDSNGAQIELLRRLRPPGSAGEFIDLCIVGDDDQAIYGFRGADPRSFDRFASIWTDQTTIPLSLNYRSLPPIIAATNSLIARAEHRFRPDKNILPGPGASPSGGGIVPLEGVILENDDHHGSVIASMILAERERQPDRPWSSFGVLAATNALVDEIAETLRASGVPVAATRPLTPLDDQGVLDLQAWMELVGGGADAAFAARLLARPPYGVPIDRINHWQGSWRRNPEGRTFLDWLAGTNLSDAAPTDLARLALRLRQDLFHQPADAAVEEIIRRTNLAEAEALDPRARAARIRRLVQVLRFVRSRQPYLDPPGNLASFLGYYRDLSDDEKQYEAPGDESLDASDTTGDNGAPSDGVRIMTAHKAKGLEFHTVFIAKVRPRGFPPSKRADEPPIATDGFLGRSRSSEADENRRLFYVACTRAERRLVLLAKEKKTRTDATDYFNELTLDTEGVRFDRSQGAAWLSRPGSPTGPADDLDREAAAGLTDSVLSREEGHARQEAASALHDARNAAADPARLAQVEERLSIAARALASIEHLRVRGELPAEALTGDLSRTPLGERLRAAAERIARGLGPASITAPLKAPLDLSYSKIEDYQRCPRCFYAKYVLGLDEARSGQISVGTIVHAALERFYGLLTEAESDGVAGPGLDELLRVGAESFERLWPLSLPIDPLAREQVEAQLRLTYEKLHDDAQVLFLERTQRFRFVTAGAAHTFTAKIDRIDRLADNRFRIVDYKTGQAYKKFTEPAADDLQFCIYALALRDVLEIPEEDPLPGGVAEYWCLAEGARGSISLADLRLDKANRKIEKAVAGMLKGDFARNPGDCKGLCAILPTD